MKKNSYRKAYDNKARLNYPTINRHCLIRHKITTPHEIINKGIEEDKRRTYDDRLKEQVRIQMQ